MFAVLNENTFRFAKAAVRRCSTKWLFLKFCKIHRKISMSEPLEVAGSGSGFSSFFELYLSFFHTISDFFNFIKRL